MLYLFITKVLFFTSITLLYYGLLLDKTNAVFLFLYFELLILLSLVIFINYTLHLESILGIIFIIFIVTLAAIKAAVGLSLIVSWVKHWGSLNIF